MVCKHLPLVLLVVKLRCITDPVWQFIIPTIIDGFGSEKANEKLDYGYDTKLFHECVVKHYSMIKGLIFVPNEEFEGSCTLSVVDADTKEPFIVNADSSLFWFESLDL
jgi:hypothetical protein